MKWMKNLYVSPLMQRDVKKIMWKLNHGAGILGTYLIILSTNEKNQLDIINAAYMKQRYYRRREIYVVGLADSYDDAIQLLMQIVEETYALTGGADVKSYLKQREANV